MGGHCSQKLSPGGECAPLRGAAYRKSTLYLTSGISPSDCPFCSLLLSRAVVSIAGAVIHPTVAWSEPGGDQLQTAWVILGEQGLLTSRERRSQPRNGGLRSDIRRVPGSTRC